MISGDLAVAERHDRHALEHGARAVRLRQRRAIAEGVAGVERLAVAHRLVHVPAEIGRRAIEPVVDHFGDPGPACERPVKHIVIDAVLGEQLSEGLALALFDGVAKGAEHGSIVHGVSPCGAVYPISATAAMIRAMSCGRDSRWSPSWIIVSTTSSLGSRCASANACRHGTSGSCAPCRMRTGQPTSMALPSRRWLRPSSISARVIG